MVAALAAAALGSSLLAQDSPGITPQELLEGYKNPSRWPMFSGDYSGQRHSPLKQIDQSNVKHLSLAWVARLSGGAGSGGPGGPGGPAAGSATIVGGEGTGDVVVGGATQIKGAILAEFGELVRAEPRMLDLALKEAEALAWQTQYPVLVFPTLAEEKVRAVAAWITHQQAVRGGQGSLAFAE